MTRLDRWVHERVPDDIDLDRPALSRLAVELARQPRFWKRFVRHDPNSRHFVQLYRDPHLDLYLICWLNSQDTGYHDHDLSSGAVYVCEGTLHEDYFGRDPDGWIREKTREHPAGSVFDFDSSYIHGVRHSSGPPATSIHAYSPALWRMGHYEPDEWGTVRRVPMTYADELASALSPAGAGTPSAGRPAILAATEPSAAKRRAAPGRRRRPAPRAGKPRTQDLC